MDTLISNVTVVTMNEKMDVLFGAFLGIQDGKLSYIGKTAPQEQPATIIDGTGMVAMPGLVNCHTHLATTALRSLWDDTARKEALEQLLQKEAKMDSRAAKAAPNAPIKPEMVGRVTLRPSSCSKARSSRVRLAAVFCALRPASNNAVSVASVRRGESPRSN